MTTIVVHRFKYFDRERNVLVESEDLATEKAIRELGGVLIPDTAVAVHDSRVSRSGILIREAGLP